MTGLELGHLCLGLLGLEGTLSEGLLGLSESTTYASSYTSSDTPSDTPSYTSYVSPYTAANPTAYASPNAPS